LLVREAYIDSAWFFITPTEGMQVYVEDENLYYFYNGSVWGTMSGGSGDMSKSTYDTDNDGIVDKAESVDDGEGNATTAVQVKANVTHTNGNGSDHENVASNSTLGLKNSDNIMVNAFRIAINGALTIFNMIDGFVDEYENEDGIDTVSSLNETYDATDDFYKPSGGSQVSENPYAHYKCNDDAANTTVTDDGSGANNGIGNVNTSNYSVVGKINEAFEFNGSEYIDIGALESDISSDNIGSFAFWFKTTTVSGTGTIISFAKTAQPETLISIHRNGATVQVTATLSDAVQWRCYTSTISINTWYHVAVVQNGTESKLYLDGSEDTTFNVTTDKTAWFDDISAIDNGRIGCISVYGLGNVDFFSGAVDDIRYYQSVLSESDADILYNSGDGSEDQNPTGPVNSMALISESVSAEAEPDNARIVILEEDVSVITLNTDLKAFASKDGGSTWAQHIER